jgi:hypothetical protein
LPAPLTLTATADRWGNVKLVWTGANGTAVWIYRNGTRVAVVANSGGYGERVRLRSGPFSYKICEVGGTRCSDGVSVGSSGRWLLAYRPATHKPHRKAHRSRTVWILVHHR